MYGVTSLNKYNKIEIISNIVSDHNDKKLEVNKRRNSGIFTYTQKLSNMLLNNQWVKEKAKREILKCHETKMDTKPTKTQGMQQKQVQKDIRNNKHLCQKERYQVNNLKELEKEE